MERSVCVLCLKGDVYIGMGVGCVSLCLFGCVSLCVVVCGCVHAGMHVEFECFSIQCLPDLCMRVFVCVCLRMEGKSSKENQAKHDKGVQRKVAH
jgi:hypothetical protein